MSAPLISGMGRTRVGGGQPASLPCLLSARDDEIVLSRVDDPDSAPFSPAPVGGPGGARHLAVLILPPPQEGGAGLAQPWEVLTTDLLGAQVPTAPSLWEHAHIHLRCVCVSQRKDAGWVMYVHPEMEAVCTNSEQLGVHCVSHTCVHIPAHTASCTQVSLHP